MDYLQLSSEQASVDVDALSPSFQIDQSESDADGDDISPADALQSFSRPSPPLRIADLGFPSIRLPMPVQRDLITAIWPSMYALGHQLPDDPDALVEILKQRIQGLVSLFQGHLRLHIRTFIPDGPPCPVDGVSTASISLNDRPLFLVVVVDRRFVRSAEETFWKDIRNGAKHLEGKRSYGLLTDGMTFTLACYDGATDILSRRTKRVAPPTELLRYLTATTPVFNHIFALLFNEFHTLIVQEADEETRELGDAVLRALSPDSDSNGQDAVALLSRLMHKIPLSDVWQSDDPYPLDERQLEDILTKSLERVYRKM